MSHLLLSHWLKQVPWLAPESVWGHCSLPPIQRWDRNRTPATDTTIYREKTERHIELLFIAILKSRWKNSARFPYFWQDLIPVPATSGMGCVCVGVCVCVCVCGCGHGTACGILVFWWGTELRPTIVKEPSPNHWTAGEFLDGERPLIGT